MNFFATIALLTLGGYALVPLAGVDTLGRLPLRNQSTYADIVIEPKYHNLAVQIPSSLDPSHTDRIILVRVFASNMGSEKIRVTCERWRTHETKEWERDAWLQPGERLQLFEGPLSRCGTSLHSSIRRFAPATFRVEVEPVSHIAEDSHLVITATWGDGP